MAGRQGREVDEPFLYSGSEDAGRGAAGRGAGTSPHAVRSTGTRHGGPRAARSGRTRLAHTARPTTPADKASYALGYSMGYQLLDLSKPVHEQLADPDGAVIFLRKMFAKGGKTLGSGFDRACFELGWEEYATGKPRRWTPKQYSSSLVVK